MKQFFAPVLSASRALLVAGLLAFAMVFIASPQPAIAQAAAPGRNANVANAAGNPATSETPKSEEDQERSFLNAPAVHKAARIMGVSEPMARDIFLIVNFLIIFLAIIIPLVRTMPKVFRKRSQTLRHSLELARQATEEARQRLTAVESKLAGLGDEIAAFRNQVEKESLEDEKRIKASLKDESERIVASVEQEISAAAAHARRGLRQFAADLAIEHAATQIKLTPDTDRELIHEFIGQVASEAGNGQAAADGQGARGGKK